MGEIVFGMAVVVGLVVALLVIFRRTLPADLPADEQVRLRRMMIVAVVVRLGIVLIWYGVVGHSFFIHEGSTKDSGMYDWGGRYVAGYLRQFVFYRPEYAQLFGEYMGPYYYIGAIYALFGHHHLMVSLLNTLGSLVMAVTIYHAALRVFDHRVAEWALGLNLFYPHYVSAGYYILKDIVVASLMGILAWCLVRAASTCPGERVVVRYLLVVVLGSLTLFRPQMGAFAAALGGIHLVLNHWKKERRIRAVTLLIAFVVITIAIIIYFQPRDRSVLDKLQDFDALAYGGPHTPSYLASARGPLEIGIRIVTNPVAFVRHLLQDVILTFWGPTYFYSQSGPDPLHKPWQNLSALLRFFVMPMAIYGVARSIRIQWVETFFLYSMIGTISFSLLFARDAFRWGLPIMPLLMVFAAVGITRFQAIRSYYAFYILALNVFVVFNVVRHDALLLAVPVALVSAVYGLGALVIRGVRYR